MTYVKRLRYKPSPMKRRKLYSTVEAAAAAGVKRTRLQFWIKTGKIAAPRVRLIGGRAVRCWTEAQVGRIRALKGTIRRGPKVGSRRAKKRGKSL